MRGRKSCMNRGDTSLRLMSRLLGKGSANVIHISDTLCAAKKYAICSSSARRKTTLRKPCSKAYLAPCHRRLPLLSIAIKLRSGYRCAKPRAYSPLPQASSSVIGCVLPNTSCHSSRISTRSPL